MFPFDDATMVKQNIFVFYENYHDNMSHIILQIVHLSGVLKMKLHNHSIFQCYSQRDIILKYIKQCPYRCYGEDIKGLLD